jgi:hypothetical protein
VALSCSISSTGKKQESSSENEKGTYTRTQEFQLSLAQRTLLACTPMEFVTMKNICKK